LNVMGSDESSPPNGIGPATSEKKPSSTPEPP
jgi:hypothetical protein